MPSSIILPASRRHGTGTLRLTVAAAALAAAIGAGEEALGQEADQEAAPGRTLAPVVVSGEKPPRSLTVPDVEAATRALRRVPGGAEVVPSERFRDGRAHGVKDMLDYAPGVFAQPKFGEDSRLSIRGSGLSRNFHLRGIRLLQDGVPLNAADGGGDFQEIDPLSLRYVEVYKGANALRYGAATLGGAINFVSPTGYDADRILVRAEAGSFDFRRLQLASGMVLGAWDYYLSPSWVMQDGYRDHSDQNSKRVNGNVGYRFDGTAETRFFVSANNIRQELPGSLSRADALSRPRRATAGALSGDQARDIDSIRLSNRTSFLLGDVEMTAGAYYANKHLYHPIFQVLDNRYQDYGGFARGAAEGTLLGHRNVLTFGATIGGGTNENERYVNRRGKKGAKTYDTTERSVNAEAYVENQFYVLPELALIAGAQLSHARRRTEDNFLSDGDDSARRRFTDINPKFGAIWEVTPDWQIFGNVSRSAEPPTFSELNPSAAPGFANLDSQKAWTVEIGTRGRSGRVAWDVSLYRAWIRDELQNFTLPDGSTFALNADRTIHQGIELGLDVALLEGLLTGDRPGRDRLELRQAYTFSDFRFDGDAQFGDNKLPGAPRHYYRAELRYTHPEGFYIGPNVEWVPQAYYVDNANTLKTKPYALLGLTAGYDFGNGLSLFLDGRNLTDKKYISNAGVVPAATPANSSVFHPGDGLAVYGGLQFRW